MDRTMDMDNDNIEQYVNADADANNLESTTKTSNSTSKYGDHHHHQQQQHVNNNANASNKIPPATYHIEQSNTTKTCPNNHNNNHTSYTRPPIPPKTNLSSSIQQQLQQQHIPPLHTVTIMNANNDDNRLSKLTLSSSLHLLNDSKFINNQQSTTMQISPDHTTTTTNNNNNNNYNNDNAHTLRDDDKLMKKNAKLSTPTRGKLIKNDNNHVVKQQNEGNVDTVHVVVGNEACDLDSAVCCLIMFHIVSKISDDVIGKDKSRTLYIPLLNTTRAMLNSKKEVVWFIEKTLNIDKSYLTCKDDINWAEIKKKNVEVLITLVDHNYNDEFKDIGRVVEIIDHHQIQSPEWFMANVNDIRLTLDTSVGSCTTLVAERLFYIYAENKVCDEILLLIYGTILLDTICLSEKAKRFTRRDVYMLKKLDLLLGQKKPNRNELYRSLVGIKNVTTRDFNFDSLMKYDLKIYKDKEGFTIGIASLFGMFGQEALGLAANAELDQFLNSEKYEAFVIMGLIADLEQSDGLSRDLVLISGNEKLFAELCSVFEDRANKLDLEIIAGGPRDDRPDPENDNILRASSSGLPMDTSGPSRRYKTRIWSQHNVAASRKAVAPIVQKVLHDGKWCA